MHWLQVLDKMSNSKEWQDSSDGWVKAMTESKEYKEKYQKYLERTDKPLSYRDWLRKYKDEGPKYEGPWGKDLGL